MTISTSLRALALSLGALAATGATAGVASAAGEPTVPFERPAQYTSVNGQLHLRVRAAEVTSTVNGREYNNLYSYETEVIGGRGTYMPGTTSRYIGPTWNVKPGDTLTIDYINDLPQQPFTSNVPGAQQEMIPQPINLHVHGLTVAPEGNSDNVLLSIPPGRSNRYRITLPKDEFHGLDWYHPHIHGLADDQVYEGLAGFINIGRADGDYTQFDGLPVEPMAIRYSVVEPNAQGGMVDASAVLTTGTALAPRGQMIYTTNGRVAPSVRINAADPATGSKAESQVWVLTNITGSASYVFALEEVAKADAANPDAVGTPVDFTIVSRDGATMPKPDVLTGDAARRGYLLGQGGRAAILVQGASDPSKVVRLVQVQNRSGSGDHSSFNWPAQQWVGNWRDYTRDVIAIGYTDPSVPNGKHVDTPSTLTARGGEPQSQYDLRKAKVDYHRTFVYNGVGNPQPGSPNNFPIDHELFPDNRVDQPRANSVEEWTILNMSSLHHPFHAHTQYGQLMQAVSPTSGPFRQQAGEYTPVQYVTDLSSGPRPSGGDVFNVPPAMLGRDGNPLTDAKGHVVQPGRLTLRVHFSSVLGTYVEHCHRLPHEDRGMMTMVRTIPNDPITAVAGAAGDPSAVDVLSRSMRSKAVLHPLGTGAGHVSVGVGDVNADAVADVATASGAGTPTRVVVRSGASGYTTRLLRTMAPFGSSYRGGATVALEDLNGDQRAEIIVGQRQGGRVVVLSGANGRVLTDFRPYGPSFRGGVSVAAGVLEAGGRSALVTAPRSGAAPTVRVFNFDLFGDAEGNFPNIQMRLTPLRVASFLAGPASYRGGLDVAAGYVYARRGGFAQLVTVPRAGRVDVRTWDAMSHEHMPENVSPSGVARPMEYDPAAPRHFMQSARLRMDGMVAGADVAATSTSAAARITVAPAAGGRLRTVLPVGAGVTLRQAGDLPVAGDNVGGM